MLKRNEPIAYSDVFVENFFKSGFEKNALLSYLIAPFLNTIQNNHSNNQECYTIAQILNELKFNVDIINWDNKSMLPLKHYDIIIDNHNNLERLAFYFTANTHKIFHATNALWLYQNQVEYKRCFEFFLRTGVAIPPSRLTTAGNSAQYADAISMFGNEFTKSTYGEYGNKVYHLPMSVTTTPEILFNRNYVEAKVNFLWLNSHGALLKGLDVAIEAFSEMPYLKLHVCGDLEADSVFFETKANQLAATSNIILEGWVDISSERFSELVTSCAWIINTSFSEGGGGSTLNCMAKGLIPIISRSASITLPEETGFYIEQNDAEHLISLINEVSQLPEQSMETMSRNVYNFVKINHSLENFRAKYKEFLLKVIE
jgi:glycosyltransferase involved in cell wall biosynthesis